MQSADTSPLAAPLGRSPYSNQWYCITIGNATGTHQVGWAIAFGHGVGKCLLWGEDLGLKPLQG